MAVSHVFSNAAGNFTGTITGFNSQGSTTTIAATNLVRPQDWNSAHNQFYTLAGNTINASTASGTNVVLSGAGGVTLGGSTGTIVISAPPPLLYSTWANVQFIPTAQTLKPTQSTFYIAPLQIDEAVTADRLRFASTLSIASTSFASTANTTFSFNQAETHRWVLFTRDTGANSMSLASVSSGSQSLKYSVNVGYGSASNTQQQHSFGITYFNSGGSSTFSTTYSTSNVSTIAISTANLGNWTGLKMADFPFNGSLSAGEYWLMMNHSTTSTTQATNLSGLRLLNSYWGVSQVNNAAAPMGQANNASNQLMLGIGTFTTVGGATTASMDFSNISSAASHVVPVVSIGRFGNA